MMCWFNKHFQLCSHHAHHNNKHSELDIVEYHYLLSTSLVSVNSWETTESYLTGKCIKKSCLARDTLFLLVAVRSKSIYRAAENMHDQLISLCWLRTWGTGGKATWFLREPVNGLKNEVGRRSLNWSFTSQLQHLKGHFHEDVIPKLDAFSSQRNTCFFWRIQKKPVHHL